MVRHKSRLQPGAHPDKAAPTVGLRMIVHAHLNGARTPDYHPCLPVSIEGLVADGPAGVTAGAAELYAYGTAVVLQ